MLTRRQFLAGAALAVGGGLGLGSYSWFVEPRWLEVVRRPLPVRGLPAALAGARLVQLSDLHVGRDVADDYVFEVFRRAARFEPDLVVVTGDFTSHHPDVVDQARRVYARLPHGRLATLGVLGNHDYGPGWSDGAHAARLAQVLKGAGVTLLDNQKTDVAGLQVVGMNDLWAGRFRPREALAGVDSARPMLALIHNPDCADEEGWEGFEGWILAGHTHGGQCRPPFLPPPLLPVRNRRYTAGEFALSAACRLYISRGVGHLSIHARFNVRPELTVFDLRPA